MDVVIATCFFILIAAFITSTVAFIAKKPFECQGVVSRVCRAVIYVRMLKCPTEHAEPLGFLLSPTRLMVGDDDIRELRGAAVAHGLLVVGVGLALLGSAFLHKYLTKTSSVLISLGSMPVRLYLLLSEYLCTGAAIGAMAMLVTTHKHRSYDYAIGITAYIILLVELIGLGVLATACGKLFKATAWLTGEQENLLPSPLNEPRAKQHDGTFLGALTQPCVAWTPALGMDRKKIKWVADAFDGFHRESCLCYVAQFGATVLLASLAAITGNADTCSVIAGLIVAVPLAVPASMYNGLPMLRHIDNIFEVALLLLEFLTAAVRLCATVSASSSVIIVADHIAASMVFAVSLKFVANLAVYVRDFHRHQQDIRQHRLRHTAGPVPDLG